MALPIKVLITQLNNIKVNLKINVNRYAHDYNLETERVYIICLAF